MTQTSELAPKDVKYAKSQTPSTFPRREVWEKKVWQLRLKCQKVTFLPKNHQKWLENGQKMTKTQPRSALAHFWRSQKWSKWARRGPFGAPYPSQMTWPDPNLTRSKSGQIWPILPPIWRQNVQIWRSQIWQGPRQTPDPCVNLGR